MAVKTQIEFTEGIYYITFTCQHWFSLFEITKSYNSVYKWFDHLRTKGYYIKGYVIMPNHLHALIDFGISSKSINTIISNAKRFMPVRPGHPGGAYKIVERLEEQNNAAILSQLSEAVIKPDKEKGKKHQVFERSFDCKEITSQYFFTQKLSYIHNSPCSGAWKLVENPVDYVHSSAKYYITGEQGIYLIN